MNESLPANDVSENWIYPYLLDFELVDNVFRSVESVKDSRLEDKKRELGEIHRRIQERSLTKAVLLGGADPKEAIPNFRQLSSEELVRFSLQVVQDVFQFVACALAFYRMLSSFRPLTTEEKEMGKSLVKLLTQLQEHLPSPIGKP